MALDAIDYEKKDDFKVSYSQKLNVVNDMVDSPYFKTKFLQLTKNLVLDVAKRDSFSIYMCVSGEVIIENEYGSISLRNGETTLITANCNSISLKSLGAKLLEVTI